MKSLLSRFVEVAKANHAPFVDKLKDALPVSYIKEKLQVNNIPIDERLLNIYSFKNGLDIDATIGELFFGVFGVYSSIEHSIGELKYIKQHKLFDESFFPIFFDDYHLLKLNSKDEKVYIYSPDDFIITPMSIYDSLDSMFLTLLEAYEKKAIFFDQGMFDSDYDYYTSIANNMNPNSEYWFR